MSTQNCLIFLAKDEVVKERPNPSLKVLTCNHCIYQEEYTSETSKSDPEDLLTFQKTTNNRTRLPFRNIASTIGNCNSSRELIGYIHSMKISNFLRNQKLYYSDLTAMTFFEKKLLQKHHKT